MTQFYGSKVFAAVNTKFVRLSKSQLLHYANRSELQHWQVADTKQILIDHN